MMRATARYLWLSLRETASLPRLTTLAAVVLTICLVPLVPPVAYDTGTGSPTTGTTQRDKSRERTPSSTVETTPQQTPETTDQQAPSTTDTPRQGDGTETQAPTITDPQTGQPNTQDQQRTPQQTAPSTGTSQTPTSEQRPNLWPDWIPFPGQQQEQQNGN